MRFGFTPGAARVLKCSTQPKLVKATTAPCKGVVKDQYYRDPGYQNVKTENLLVRWTPGHRELHSATTYRDYLDIQGNNDSDTMANMGDDFPMEMPPPKPHDIVLHGHIMPTPAKHGQCNYDDKNKKQTYTVSAGSGQNTTDRPHGSRGCGDRYVGGAKERLGNASQLYAVNVASGTGVPCRCGWPCAILGPFFGLSGGLGGTNGRHTPNLGSRQQ